MPTVSWTPTAQAELDEITQFLLKSGQSTRAVETIARELLADCDRYAGFPRLGAASPEIGENCRVFSHKRWAIIYRPNQEGITVVGVVDAARDYPAWRRP